MTDLDAKLAEVALQYDSLQAELSRPETSADPSEIRRLGQELARLEPTVEAFRRLESIRHELAGVREIGDAGDGDEEMRVMARDEIARLEVEESRLLDDLKVLLLPRDPNDDRDVILEIRAGAGGDEAALFAAELFRMYTRYATRHGFKPEVMSVHETGIDGIKEAIVQVRGDGAYSRLKFEGGVHRVQRIPATESSGRIHTSTATVVVLPEADEVEVQIDEERDLRIDVKRSSGPGGQSVNTTDSAVRITHLPTGIVVTCQNERSQIQNRARAMEVLQAKLLEVRRQQDAEEMDKLRGTHMSASFGAGENKVRDYVLHPYQLVKDARTEVEVGNTSAVLDGDIDAFIDAEIRWRRQQAS